MKMIMTYNTLKLSSEAVQMRLDSLHCPVKVTFRAEDLKMWLSQWFSQSETCYTEQSSK